MKAQSQNPRHIQHSKATCELRDRLLKFTTAHFRRCHIRRTPEELLQHLYKTQAALEQAEIEARRPIDAEAIKKRNEVANNALLKKKPSLANEPWRLWKTDLREIVQREKDRRRDSILHLREEMEPHRAAGVPLHERDFQPRYWKKLTRAGLIHDEMLCFHKAALALLEAKTKEAA
jgi:hypothetical protein